MVGGYFNQIGDKHCSKCKTIKPLDQFANNWMTPDGKQNWCKECMKHQRQARKQALKNSVVVP